MTQKQLQQREEKLRELEERAQKQNAEARAEAELLSRKLEAAEKALAEQESSFVQVNVKSQLSNQEATELRRHLEEYKVSLATAQQLAKAKAAEAADAQARLGAAEGEAAKLKLQSAAARSAEPGPDVRLLKAQLQKADLDREALRNEVKAKVGENQQLQNMCDELMSLLESKKSRARARTAHY
jgi:hypothetical protein